jgi:hypothetical protein
VPTAARTSSSQTISPLPRCVMPRLPRDLSLPVWTIMRSLPGRRRSARDPRMHDRNAGTVLYEPPEITILRLARVHVSRKVYLPVSRSRHL